MGSTTTAAAGCELRFAGMLQESSTGGAKLKKQSRTAYGPKSISLRTFPPAKSTLRLIRLILSSDTIEYLPGTRSSCRPWSWRGCVGPGWILITQDLAFDSKRIRVLRSAGFTEPPIISAIGIGGVTDPTSSERWSLLFRNLGRSLPLRNDEVTNKTIFIRDRIFSGCLRELLRIFRVASAAIRLT